MTGRQKDEEERQAAHYSYYKLPSSSRHQQLKTMTPASSSLPNKRRLVLTIYRSLMRWCNDIPPSIPLDEFIPPMRETVMDDVGVFKRLLREEFREPVPNKDALKLRIQTGLEGMRQLNEVHPEVMAYSRQWGERIRKKQQNKNTRKSDPFDEREWIQERIDAIRWLPKLEESPPHSLEIEADSKFPLFPLQSALFHADTLLTEDNEPVPLPLFTPQSEIPVPGMEVPLKIFEPRYRQLYTDLRQQPANMRNLVVPFCHPMVPGQFAQYGLVYQLTQLQEVADETSGKIQYFANHVVTKPIQILRVLNPQVWDTKETYLQVQGRVLDDRSDMDHSVYEPVKEFLTDWKQETSNPLAVKSLLALEGEGFWAMVNLWNAHQQQELIQLQLGVATQVKRQARIGDITTAISNPTSNITPEIVALAQQPHRKRLLQLLLDTSLLVPTLLSLDAPGKCQHMIQRLEDERKQL